MNDPYQVLGISRGASDEEIKKAYRTQCKRWHPDLNPDDPTAEEHFKEVQEAYDTLMKGPQQQTSYQNPYQNPYGGYQQTYYQQSYGNPFDFNDFFGGYYNQQGYGGQSSYQGTDTPQMQAARNFIATRHYAEARRVLDEIHDRNARWYYLSALANQGLGNRVSALNDARQACQMDPQNMEYRSLYNQMQGPSSAYQQRSTSYGGSGFLNTCMNLIWLNLLCNCCLGGRCFFPCFFI